MTVARAPPPIRHCVASTCRGGGALMTVVPAHLCPYAHCVASRRRGGGALMTVVGATEDQAPGTDRDARRVRGTRQSVGQRRSHSTGLRAGRHLRRAADDVLRRRGAPRHHERPERVPGRRVARGQWWLHRHCSKAASTTSTTTGRWPGSWGRSPVRSTGPRRSSSPAWASRWRSVPGCSTSVVRVRSSSARPSPGTWASGSRCRRSSISPPPSSQGSSAARCGASSPEF